ncbi:MAG: DUF1538 domain-containing protein [Clostridiales bacterium]|nr:DUF1538 domain-containing protein [Clostridiales bacterium]
MLRTLLSKIKESLISVLPVVAIVLILCCTPLVNLSWVEIVVFCVSALLLIVGIGLFNLGADLAMSPMGEYIGSGLTKSKKLAVLLVVSFVMGVLITVAEPDLSVLAEQIENKVNPIVLIVSVGVGVGTFLLLGTLKILFKKSLSAMLIFFYLVIFALVALLVVDEGGDFLALSFDSGGVTTGPITAPFIIAMGVGIAGVLGGRDSGENSFGLLALCSVGPILTVMILGLTSSGNVDYTVDASVYAVSDKVVVAFFHEMWEVIKDVALALGLICVAFTILQFTCLKLPAARIKRIAIGIAFTFVGLVIFLTAVSVGFLPIGFKLGSQIAETPWLLVLIGFVLGMLVVLAEPAVHVLNKQVEEVTSRAITRKSMMIALAIGVGISIGLSMLRIWLDFSILYYLIPGYILSLGLSFFVPKLYTAIAFDSGGVASGPLTSTFILPFAIGACLTVHGESKILVDAFGIVAMVAMTPLITIQLLGFRAIVSRNVRNRIAQRRIISADDDQIINF